MGERQSNQYGFKVSERMLKGGYGQKVVEFMDERSHPVVRIDTFGANDDCPKRILPLTPEVKSCTDLSMSEKIESSAQLFLPAGTNFIETVEFKVDDPINSCLKRPLVISLYKGTEAYELRPDESLSQLFFEGNTLCSVMLPLEYSEKGRKRPLQKPINEFVQLLHLAKSASPSQIKQAALQSEKKFENICEDALSEGIKITLEDIEKAEGKGRQAIKEAIDHIGAPLNFSNIQLEKINFEQLLSTYFLGEGIAHPRIYDGLSQRMQKIYRETILGRCAFSAAGLLEDQDIYSLRLYLGPFSLQNFGVQLVQREGSDTIVLNGEGVVPDYQWGKVLPLPYRSLIAEKTRNGILSLSSHGLNDAFVARVPLTVPYQKIFELAHLPEADFRKVRQAAGVSYLYLPSVVES